VSSNGFQAREPQTRFDLWDSGANLCGATGGLINTLRLVVGPVVPQQPPTMLTRPLAANSPISRRHIFPGFSFVTGRIHWAIRRSDRAQTKRIGDAADVGNVRGRANPRRRRPRKLKPMVIGLACSPPSSRTPRAIGPNKSRPDLSVMGAGRSSPGTSSPRACVISGDRNKAPALALERVEDGLEQQKIGAAGRAGAVDLFAIPPCVDRSKVTARNSGARYVRRESMRLRFGSGRSPRQRSALCRPRR